MHEFFPSNLKHLCRHCRSISDVCRKLKIHRGQFNKYLRGSSFPAPFNLKRICDFFGVEEYEIVLPTEQFTRLVSDRKRPTTLSLVTAPQSAVEHLRQWSSPQLQSLVGYYHEYGYSMSDPGHILCALVNIHEADGHFVYERNERLKTNILGREDEHYQYKGVAYYLGDRLFLIDYESLASSEINQTILIPSFKSRNTRLNGLKMGVTACDHRTPVCSRVVWDFLGKDVCRLNAYRRVRLYGADDQEIDADLKTRLSQTQIIDGLFQIV